MFARGSDIGGELRDRSIAHDTLWRNAGLVLLVQAVLCAEILQVFCRGCRYVAMFPYTPRKEDELELRKGEMFLVLERCQDGWFKGTSMHTGKIGVFPGNYMSPVSRSAFGSWLLSTCLHKLNLMCLMN